MFDAFSLYQQNAQKLKIRESTTYGIHIDEESGVVVACSDFGHIHVYSHEIKKTLECDNMNQNESQCTNSGSTLSNKTLHTAIPPIFSCKVGHFSSAKILFCGGSNNTLKGYLWDTIMTSEHNSVIVPDFNLMGGSADNVGSVVSIACVSKHNLVYAATDNGSIFCCTVPAAPHLPSHSPTTLVSVATVHSSAVHSLCLIGDDDFLFSCDSNGLVCVWDARNPGNLIGKSSNIAAGIAETLDEAPASVWVSSMDVDLDGNFIYVGGGIDASRAAGTKGVKAFHQPHRGWLASFMLSNASNTASIDKTHMNGGGVDNMTTLIKCIEVPVPIQTLLLRGTELVTGGSQPLLTYWRSYSLERMSAMKTSSQSIFAIATCGSTSGLSEDAKLLAVGGSLPVVDLVSVVGHKEAVFCPF